MPKSKSDLLIIKAVEAGYTANEFGEIFTPSGNKLKLSTNNKGYLSFMPNIGERSLRRTILAHRFILYYFYKETLFKWPLVRHLNDVKTDNRLINLAVGTKQDNRKDISPERLSSIAKKNAHILVALSRKLSDTQIHEMRKLRELDNTPYHILAKKFGVSVMTVYRAVNKQSWSNL